MRLYPLGLNGGIISLILSRTPPLMELDDFKFYLCELMKLDCEVFPDIKLSVLLEEV